MRAYSSRRILILVWHAYIFVRCTSEQYCCKFVSLLLLLFLYYYYYYYFLSANCRATIPERKKAITSRACYFFKEMTVYRVHSCTHTHTHTRIRIGRLKSNFLFHKTIWRSLECTCMRVYVYVLAGALVAADRNNRHYLILRLPPDKKKKGS